MMESDKKDPKLEQNQHEKPMSLLQKALLTGFVGGLLWSAIGSFAYYFNFSEVSHASFTLRSFWQASWSSGLTGELISMLVVGIASILAAFLYYLFLRKRAGMIPGILYGVAVWFIFMYFLNPFFESVPTITEMEMNTVVSTICLLVLYGTFIGYSISFDYESYEQAKASKNKSSQNAG
jgi:uncharacterized membrane protein